MIGIIGGSGLYSLDGLVEIDRTRCTTAYGEPSSELVRVCGQHADSENKGKNKGGNQSKPKPVLLFVARHGADHAIPPHRVNYRANVQALCDAGVTHIVAVNAVGSCNARFAVGDIVLPTQLIDYTSGREHTFFDQLRDFNDHIDFTEPFSESLQHRLQAVAEVVNVKTQLGGTYGVTQGPRLETAAEVQRLIRDGCDLIGMTAMPEAALAREKGLAYASLCVVVNSAAGLDSQVISTEAISAVLAQSMERIGKMISSLLEPA